MFSSIIGQTFLAASRYSTKSAGLMFCPFFKNSKQETLNPPAKGWSASGGK
jgi:hypothetical protein